MDALDKASNAMGSDAALARAIGMTRQAVSDMRRRGVVSPEAAVAIEKATGGRVKRRDLRPDLFGAVK